MASVYIRLLFDQINGDTKESFTYSQVKDAVWRVSNALARHGLEKDDVLLMVSRNSPEYVITFLAAASFGAIPTVVNPDFPRGGCRKKLSSWVRWIISVPP